jgi:inositol-hexakisphosphate/diphosphoinositol-pentakisphosphate 1-kinase
LLRPGSKAAPQFTWPKDQPEPRVVMQRVVELMHWHQSVLNENYCKMGGAIEKVQTRWCCAENPTLFRERWEKLFQEFAEADKVCNNSKSLLIIRLIHQKCRNYMIQ